MNHVFSKPFSRVCLLKKKKTSVNESTIIFGFAKKFNDMTLFSTFLSISTKMTSAEKSRIQKLQRTRINFLSSNLNFHGFHIS